MSKTKIFVLGIMAIVGPLFAVACLDPFERANYTTGGNGGNPTTSVAPAAEPTCPSDGKEPPSGESWWACACRCHNRGSSMNGVPAPPIGDAFLITLKVPAKSAVDAAAKITAAMTGGEKITSLLYSLDGILGCVPWVPGGNHRGPVKHDPLPHVEDETDGICTLPTIMSTCSAAMLGEDCADDSGCCSGLCSGQNTCEACRGDTETCSVDADCCSGICAIGGCGG